MAKNTTSRKYDDAEDKEIKSVAYYKSVSNTLLLILLIALFLVTLFTSFYYVKNYYKNKNDMKVIEIKKNNSKVLISNSEEVNKTISDKDIENNQDLTIENYSSITIVGKEDGELLYNVKYKIDKNDFPYNPVATIDSDVLVRFSYSYDLKEWNYINNIISTNNTNLSPLVMNVYDIGGLTTTLNVATNEMINYKAGENVTIYWRSETILKNKDTNIGRNIRGEFKIEYKDSD